MTIRQLVTAIVLATAVVSVLLAVPPLRRVVDDVGRLTPGWLALAIALELASCASFVVIFRRFFDGVPGGAARRLAWTEMGSGALVPGGGVGALAIGGWLLHRAGMSTKRIVERSSGLFFLTTATNVLFLFGAGIALALGVAGPHDAVLDAVPVVAAVAVTVAVLALPRLTRRGVVRPRGRVALLRDLISGIGEAERALLRPSWRLIGAIGYLGFDIAVLWATFEAVGYSPAVAPLILAYILGYLADLIPVPGGIGVLEGGLAGTLVIYGAPATQAAAAVLVYHAVAFWIPSLGGLLAYTTLRRELPGMRPAERAVERQVERLVPTMAAAGGSATVLELRGQRDPSDRSPIAHPSQYRQGPPLPQTDPNAGGGAPDLNRAVARALPSSSSAAGYVRPKHRSQPMTRAHDHPSPADDNRVAP